YITKNNPWRTSCINDTKASVENEKEFKLGKQDIILVMDIHYLNPLINKQSAIRAIVRIHRNQVVNETRIGYEYYENEPI
ncbi:MAG: hypothetical protein MUE72_07280, partial [Chitinophagaceae bacterium]|nr:hypothetical protein [Chitinophagaceae bacterium]